MSDTPRSDGCLIKNINGEWIPHCIGQQLERELAEATRDASNQREKQSECLRELAEKTRLLAEARDYVAELLERENEALRKLLAGAAEQVDREFHQNNTSSLRKCEIDALFKLHNTLAALNKEQQ